MVSCTIFATVVVACKKQEQRETIVDDQQDMDISKAADAVVESEHVGGQLKTKTPNVSLLSYSFVKKYLLVVASSMLWTGQWMSQ